MKINFDGEGRFARVATLLMALLEAGLFGLTIWVPSGVVISVRVGLTVAALFLVLAQCIRQILTIENRDAARRDFSAVLRLTSVRFSVERKFDAEMTQTFRVETRDASEEAPAVEDEEGVHFSLSDETEGESAVPNEPIDDKPSGTSIAGEAEEPAVDTVEDPLQLSEESPAEIEGDSGPPVSPSDDESSTPTSVPIPESAPSGAYLPDVRDDDYLEIPAFLRRREGDPPRMALLRKKPDVPDLGVDAPTGPLILPTTNDEYVEALEEQDEVFRLRSLERSSIIVRGQPNDPCQYRVWFGTDRRPNQAGDYSAGFSEKFDSRLHCGSCVVYVPKSHQSGSTGSPLLLRLVKRVMRRPENAPLQVIAIEDGTSASLTRDLLSHLSEVDSRQRELTLFIHGYNVSFESAAIRAAQIGRDLAVQGPMVFYSWPSKGKLEDYTVDMRTVDRSFRRLMEFMNLLMSIPSLTALNVVAHSMGNQLLSRAAELMAAGNALANIGHVVLAAPDVDRYSFREVAASYSKLRTWPNRRTTLYWNHSDRALAVSKVINGALAIGASGKNVVGVDSILWTNPWFRLDWLGHGYFAEAAPVIHDMRKLLSQHMPPHQRPPLKPIPVDIPQYWDLRG